MRKILGIGLYTVLEVAELLNVSERTARNYIKGGRLQAQKIGGEWAISEEALRAFLHGPTPSAAVNLIGTTRHGATLPDFR